MKILVQAVPKNHLFGFKDLFEARKHQWVWWEETHTPAFDAFDEIRPDLFIGTGQPSKALLKCIEVYKPAVMVQSGPYTYEIAGIELAYPLLVNASVHQPAAPNPALSCDIACCEEPHPHLLSLCKFIDKFDIKILGNYQWPVPQYLGIAPWQQLVQLYQSASIVYANTLEEAGRAMGCKTAWITSNPQLEEQLGCKIYLVDSAEALYDECHNMLKSNPQFKAMAAEDGYNFIHTQELTYQRAFSEICAILNKKGCKV